MASNKIEIPSFSFAKGYTYPALLEFLTLFKRVNASELTDESEFEPMTQLLRAFALVGHLNGTLLDMLANENTLPTARLPQTVRDMLKLIGQPLQPASPSQADILFELAGVLTATETIVPALSQVATPRQGDIEAVVFEVLDALEVTATNERVGVAFSEEASAFTDRTADAQGAVAFAPWATPAAGDMLYVGHDTAMWDQMDVEFSTPGDDIAGAWEFYDGDTDDAEPDVVTDLGTTIRFDLNGLLGDENRAGATVRVRFNDTTAYEDRVSQWDGSTNFVTTSGLLGQTTVSTDETDYTVGTDWKELDVDDGTLQLTQDGSITFDVPQSVDNDWRKTTVNGVEAFFLRFRIISVATPTAPTISLLSVLEAKRYALAEATQGRTVTETLGTSSGEPNQRFTGSKVGAISGTVTVEVDGAPWTQVENFLTSRATEEHFVVEFDEDDTIAIVFGDGVAGAIPGVGANNVVGTYRYGTDQDGNVGAGAITIDKAGLPRVNKLRNPRAASGWAAAEGSDAASLERAKVRAPAALRTRDTAVSPTDVARLATSFEDEDGVRPFSRAFAIEEGFGPKTVELVLVGRGNQVPTSGQLEEMDEYLNGDKYASPPLPKRIVANQEATSTAFSPRAIDIVVEIEGDFEIEAVKNQLSRFLQPEAVRKDGVTYRWNFGGEVSRERIIHEIFEGVEESGGEATGLTLTTPAAAVSLGTRSLPVPGTLTITKAA